MDVRETYGPGDDDAEAFEVEAACGHVLSPAREVYRPVKAVKAVTAAASAGAAHAVVNDGF